MVLVLALVAALVTGVMLVRRPFPQVDGEIRLAGLDAEVTVVRDAHGIPQIYADTTADLMRAQGFVHAQERFYEMDVRRHATAGRLAELFGEPALESDRFVRTMGWRRIAAEELALIKPETRAALEQYAEGVNAYLEDRDPSDISVQYTILNAGGLGYRPEPWTAVDSLSWLKAMAWDLRGNMDDEIGRALSIASVGPERTEDLYPGYDYDAHQPIVTEGAVVDGVFEQEAGDAARPSARPGRRTRRPWRACWPGSRPGSTPCRRTSAAATGWGATPGWSTASTPRPEHRSWPTTRTWASACPASGCRWDCTAGRCRRSARSTSRGSRSAACRA